MRFAIALMPLAALASTPALAQNAEPAGPTPEQAAAERAYHNAQQAYLSGLMASDGWYTGEGGLRWRYIRYVGTGEKPTPADTVTVNYEGSFIDGAVFDSSYQRGQPATFPLSGLIKAWELAIPEMHVGEVIELAAPADLAYGPRGRRTIPGGATLIFKVELIAIEDP